MSNGLKKGSVSAAQRIVFANGIFDLLHDGHRELLKFAKSCGDWLIVGINSDRATKLLKGEDRPIHNELKRKENLEELEFVDEVVIFDDIHTTEGILQIRPQVVVKGAEWPVEAVREIDHIPLDIEIQLFPLISDANGVKVSTTASIARMKKDIR